MLGSDTDTYITVDWDKRELTVRRGNRGCRATWMEGQRPGGIEIAHGEVNVLIQTEK